MPQIPNYNLSDLPDSANVPAGRYRIKLTKAVLKKTRETKKPMFEFTWRIASGPLAEKKVTVKSWLVIDPGNPSSDVSLKQFAIAMGRKKTTGMNTDELIGKVVTGVVAVGKYSNPTTGITRDSSSIIALLPKDAPLKVSGDEDIEEEGEDEAEEEAEEEKPKKKKKPAKKSEEDDDDIFAEDDTEE